MRIIKLAIISFVVFFGLFTFISLMFPSQVRLSKAINIHAQKSAVLAPISNTSRWVEWHPGFQPTAKVPVITPVLLTDSLIVMNLNSGGKTMVNGWQVYVHNGSDSVTLQWYMDFKLQWYPWQKFGSLFFENTYGVMMQNGLQNLKTLTEEKAEKDTLF